LARLNAQNCSTATLDIAWVYPSTHLPTAGIGHNMALAPLDLLGRISTSRPAGLGRLDRLTVDYPRRRARFAARRFARFHQQRKIDLLEQAVVAPVVEIALHGSERREVLGQHSPLTASPRH